MKKIIKKVWQSIRIHGLIQKGDRVVVGLSGGADSVMLFHSLAVLREIMPFDMHAVHIHHMLRKQQADMDLEFCTSLAKKYGIPFSYERIDVGKRAIKERMSVEETGRLVRYEVLQIEAGKTKKGVIAVGHHRDDHVETIMMNLFRGCGTEGLCGLKWKNGNVVRPLLCLRKSEIQLFLQQNHIDYMTDESNLDNRYTRNKMRNVIIPCIEQTLGTDVSKLILRTSDIVRADYEYIEKQSKEAFYQCKTMKDKRIRLDVRMMQTYEHAIRRNVIRLFYTNVVEQRTGLTKKHIESIDSLIDQNATSASVDLPNDWRAVVRYGDLFIEKSKETNTKNKCTKLDPPGSIRLEEFCGTLKAAIFEYRQAMDYVSLSGSFDQYFDWDKLRSPLIIRNRQEGDHISLMHFQGHTKKVKQLFIDEKIEQPKRSSVPIVVAKDQIIWVVGLRRSKHALITEQTTRVLHLHFAADDTCNESG